MPGLRDAFITGTGAFLPGEPVTNDRVEDFIGRVGGRKSPTGQRVLRWNGIDTRHYALTPAGEALYSNASMSAAAVVTALQDAGLGRESLQFLRPRATSWCLATAAPSMANWAAAHWNSRAFNQPASLP
jgi:3-oxoacyl-[acyl-carrier-protein] synthase III